MITLTRENDREISSTRQCNSQQRSIFGVPKVMDAISLSEAPKFHQLVVEESKFINHLLVRQKRLDQPISLDRIHYILSGQSKFVLIFVRPDPQLSGKISIVYTNDKWKTVHECRVSTYLADDVKFNNKFGQNGGAGWFDQRWRMSSSSMYSTIPKDKIYCILFPRNEIEWFAIKLDTFYDTHWDNNHGWNYSLTYEEGIGAISTYRSPSPDYMYNFKRYYHTEIDGDGVEPDKEYGSNIYLPTVDDWTKEILRSSIH